MDKVEKDFQQNYEYHRLKNEYTHDKAHFEYADRLRVFAQAFLA